MVVPMAVMMKEGMYGHFFQRIKDMEFRFLKPTEMGNRRGTGFHSMYGSRNGISVAVEKLGYQKKHFGEDK